MPHDRDQLGMIVCAICRGAPDAQVSKDRALDLGLGQFGRRAPRPRRGGGLTLCLLAGAF
jgi:hypothetical protein